MFIQTEETPNPLTLKFIPNRPVIQNGTADFPNAESAKQSLLASKLFEISNIEGVFLGSDFIAITRNRDADWLTLKPAILTTIMEYFLTHKTADLKEPESNTTAEFEDEVSREIIDLLETRIRPAVAQDGGDIIFEKFEDGIVYVKLQGACSGCPSSSATLKSGIENMLKHYIPEVHEVRAI